MQFSMVGLMGPLNDELRFSTPHEKDQTWGNGRAWVPSADSTQ